MRAGASSSVRELSEALEAQRTAKQQAEAANLGKTRFFVAAASHDLLQPLNAARLFVSALESRATTHPDIRELAARIDGSMRAAEDLLKDLLDIAQLDIGVMRPDVTVFSIGELLDDLRTQFAPLAQSRSLRLEGVVSCRELVRSDRTLLRRILQNYLSNGLRYCEHGGSSWAAGGAGRISRSACTTQAPESPRTSVRSFTSSSRDWNRDRLGVRRGWAWGFPSATG